MIVRCVPYTLSRSGARSICRSSESLLSRRARLTLNPREKAQQSVTLHRGRQNTPRLTRHASTESVNNARLTSSPVLDGSSASRNILALGDSAAANKSKAVASWLFCTAGAVAVMVTVGGITRMTKSGLSMTDWKLQGSLPPITEGVGRTGGIDCVAGDKPNACDSMRCVMGVRSAVPRLVHCIFCGLRAIQESATVVETAEWEEEFTRYKTFPEWQQRRSMTLEEFKSIFFWEYAHRMLGRTLGLVYGLPLLYFGIRGQIPQHIRGRVIGLLALGGGQGLVGWWMVKSGLENRDADLASGKEIRVSPYRLAAHLGTAFVTFFLLVHTGLLALNGPRASFVSPVAQLLNESGLLRQASRLRVGAAGVCGIAFLTAVSGAFVAGNDAGRCYNYFPKMTEDTWLPEEILALRPAWRNFFENSATVQADHRALALTTTAAALGLYWYARRGAASGALWQALPPSSKLATSATAGLVTAQASLGITTLLHAAPLPLAAAHQAGALTVLASSIWTAHALRSARYDLLPPPTTSDPAISEKQDAHDNVVRP